MKFLIHWDQLIHKLMFPLHHLRNALAASTLAIIGSLVPSAGVASDVWYMEGYIATGSATSAGSLTRIHGTLQFTANQIQFSTNVGSFTREASLAGMEYSSVREEPYTYWDATSDPPVRVTKYLVVENTKAKITPVDASTLVLNFGNTKYPLYDSQGKFAHNLKSYEWIAVVLTKRAVSSRLFPFDEESVELWLQPDFYEGSSTLFETNHVTRSIDSGSFSDPMTIGGSPLDGFFVEWLDEVTQIQPTPSLNELLDDFSDTNRILVATDYSDPNLPSPPGPYKYEHYRNEDWGAFRLLHLGDGRLFWLQAGSSIGETITTDFWSQETWSTGAYIFSAQMECGVLEQKLWFEASFSSQDITMQSETLGGSALPSMDTSPVPSPKPALIQVLRGEAFEVNGTVERSLKVGDRVSLGSVVRTGDKSYVKIVFVDRSQINIGSDSEMRVEAFSGKDSGIIDLIKGVIRSQVTKDYLQIESTNKSKLFIKTRNCAIGVRGTEFEVSYSEDQDIGTTQLQMVEGSVEFSNLVTGVITTATNQDLIVAQGPVIGSGSSGPKIAVLDPTLQSLTSGVSSQSLGMVAPLGSSEPLVLRIRNTGKTALTGVNPVIRGAHAADFLIFQSPENSLPPLVGEGILKIVFTPSAFGSRQAVLEISNSDGDESPFLINLEGTGANPSATDYAGWSGGASFDADANGDGVHNGLAFLLGATNPNASAFALLPTVTASNGNITFNFSVLNAAHRNGASLRLEYSSDLGISNPWATTLVPDVSSIVNGVTFNVTPGSRHSQVTATIPATEAISGRLFGRLKAVE